MHKRIFVVLGLITAACSSKPSPGGYQGPATVPPITGQTILTTVHCGSKGNTFYGDHKFTIQELAGRYWIDRDSGQTITVTLSCNID